MVSVLKERSNKTRQQHIAKLPHIEILIELITKKSFLHKKSGQTVIVASS